jgi:hypothetical protein
MELLKNLSAEEQQLMKDAIAYITILVAGADDNIDANEIAASTKLAEVRSFSFYDVLVPYYQEVKVDLKDKIHALIEDLPNDVHARQEIISKELARLNSILKKLGTHHGHVFYDNFVSFAKHVAKSSGGIIGFMTIGPEEKKVVDLPMIDPIVED